MPENDRTSPDGDIEAQRGPASGLAAGAEMNGAHVSLALATRAVLAERFPACFMPKGANKPPLKVGIHHDVVARCPDLEPSAISAALADYTRGKTYKRNLRAGAARLDLDGTPSGTVSDEQVKRRWPHPAKVWRVTNRLAALLREARAAGLAKSEGWAREADAALAVHVALSEPPPGTGDSTSSEADRSPGPVVERRLAEDEEGRR